ncbi:MAG: D-alanyl-D-alanine carboxypeptidase family protein [Oscillospiraceae bacterium]
MTREQAEKQKKRKKRLLKRRIWAAATIISIVVLIAFAVWLALPMVKEFMSKPSAESPPLSSPEISEPPVEPTAQPVETPQPTPEPIVELPKPPASWETTLVNQSNPLPADFTVEVRTIKGTEKNYDVRAADSLEAMLSDAEKAGFKMYLVSTYRTVAYQQGLFNRKINEYKSAGYDDATAKEEAAKWVAVPGYSEHNLGLAADIVSSTWYNNNSDLTADFENTDHFNWLVNNCTKYGFILRYPKGKEAVTGITYEPWHYRYVGVEAAKYITEKGITLEEFHE